MKRLSWTLVALVAAGVFLFLWALPPRPSVVDASAWGDLAARTVPGAYHIHTTRSDGLGDRTAVAAAAARAGLKFIILTDHGDGTRPPDPPVYLDGVLVLDGVEISTSDGHYVAIDMPRSPYPLGGAAGAVVEDVARLGGFGLAAHPDSPKPQLRWTDDRAPIDGIEWLNTDSEWRGESSARLLRAGLAYFLRPGPALAGLFDRPGTLDRWDRLAATRPVVALAGADAHGGVKTVAEDPGRSLLGMVGIPGYEASFRAFSNRVVLERPLSGDAAADARAVYAAIRKGSVFTAIDAVAGPALLDLHVEAGQRWIGMGGVLPADSDATIVARSPLPAEATLVLLQGQKEIATGRSEIRHSLTGAQGAYRVEVSVPGAPGQPPIPWLVSNGISFLANPAGAPTVPSVNSPGPLRDAIAPFPWRIEKDPNSSGILRTTETSASLRFQLRDGDRAGQFVAMATDMNPQPFGSIDLWMAGDRPMRVSVQLRTADGRRWGRSCYVDPKGTAVRVPVSSLTPIGAATGSIDAAQATSLLLVIDLTNAAPGRTGTLTVQASAFAR